MKDNLNIDELFSGLIDGELSQRQLTEVKRLLANDSRLAERLRRLERCKVLLSSLPQAEAPAGIAEEVRARLERRALLDEHSETIRERQGARGLMIRRVLATAAMFLLVAVLGIVIYTILSSGDSAQSPVSGVERVTSTEVAETSVDSGGESSILAAWADVQLNARLELTTGSLAAAKGKLNRILREHLPADTGYEVPGSWDTYAISCNSQTLDLIFADLRSAWDSFETVDFIVEGAAGGKDINVSNATADQIMRIISQDNFEQSKRLARDFAVLNGVEEKLPANEFADATSIEELSLRMPPKPKLTSGEKHVKKDKEVEQHGGKINLTIAVERAGS